MQPPSRIIITGASSGLGAALAECYAGDGITLGLTGRNTARLEHTAAACRAKGAYVETATMDVRNATGMQAWIESFDRRYPVDLLIANAGISSGSVDDDAGGSRMRELFATNVDGVINSIMPAIACMRTRRKGQIAMISSLAAIRGLPSCPAYSASKAAIRFLGEGLRGELKTEGIRVSVVCPGYIKTPMTEVNHFPMPFLMPPEKAARIILKGLAKNRSRIAFPLPLYIPLWLLSCLPTALTDPLFAALPKKIS